MLRQEDFIEITGQNQKGVYQKDIAAELGVHHKTVSRALKQAGAPAEQNWKRGSSVKKRSKIGLVLIHKVSLYAAFISCISERCIQGYQREPCPESKIQIGCIKT